MQSLLAEARSAGVDAGHASSSSSFSAAVERSGLDTKLNSNPSTDLKRMAHETRQTKVTFLPVLNISQGAFARKKSKISQ